MSLKELSKWSINELEKCEIDKARCEEKLAQCVESVELTTTNLSLCLDKGKVIWEALPEARREIIREDEPEFAERLDVWVLPIVEEIVDEVI